MFGLIAKIVGGGGIKAIGTNWKLILIGAMALVIGYQNISDTRWVLWADTIPFLKAELAIIEYENDIIKQRNAHLTDVIEERNAEIERWSNVTKQLEQNTALLQDEIAGISLKAKDRISIVEKQIIPQECSGAMHYLFDSIPELQYDDILQLDGGGL